MTNDYHFITRWRVEASAEEVFALISEPAHYPRWWSSVYLKVLELEPGQADGLGRRFRFHTKGWLPYTLDWESCAIESKPQTVWQFAQLATSMDVAYGQCARTEYSRRLNLTGSSQLKNGFCAISRFSSNLFSRLTTTGPCAAGSKASRWN